MTTETTETDIRDIKFMTIAEVAALLRVSRMTVYRLCHAEDIDAMRVGRSFRIPEQAVLAYLHGGGAK